MSLPLFTVLGWISGHPTNHLCGNDIKQGLASRPCFWYVKKHGEVSEWFNVLVLKTNVAQVTVGSNPTLSEKIFF